ncbi:MAG: threonine synthase [Clostridiales bacterium]|nr:threonine synthase [Clostridiales bacterium]
MLFLSTRGAGGRISAQEAILKGMAGDGGLYVPESLPRVGPGFIEGLGRMGYAGAAAKIVKLFMDDFSDAEIAECAEAAYSPRNFDSEAVAPLHALGDGSTYVLELFHGPTGAFKDMALQLLPPLLTKCLDKAGSPGEAAILVATSGDTGKAALEGFRDVPGTRILVFYPEDGVSEIQKLQMVTQEGGNARVAAVRGNFDDAQAGVKAVFADAAVAERLRGRGIFLSSANSINWGRLMPQIAYYFWAYAALLERGAARMGERVQFAVPTGNFGNILAGWYAKEMGLPISRLICASNANNVLSDFIATGVYDRNRGFAATMSPSMDILVSSNLERLLFELSGRDAALVSGWMADLARRGRYDVGERVRAAMAATFAGGYATEDATRAAIKGVFEKYRYLMDTHTAVGMSVYADMKAKAKAGTKAEAKAKTGAETAPAAGGGEAGRADGAKSAVAAAKGAEDDAGGRGASVPREAAARGGAANAASACGKAAFRGAADDAARGADGGEITVLVSTASPYKFAKDVYLSVAGGGGAAEAGGGAPKGAVGGRDGLASGGGGLGDAPGGDEFEYIDRLESVSGAAAPKWLAGLRGKPRRHFAVAERDKIKDAALSLLLGGED